MKKKIVALLLAITTMCMVLTGCMAEEIKINFNSDGSGEMTIGMYFAPEFYESFGTTPEEVFAEEIASGQRLVTKSIDNKTYTGITASADFSNIQELNTILSDSSETAGGEAPSSTFTATEQYQNGNRVVVVAGYIVSDEEMTSDVPMEGVDASELENMLHVSMTLTFTDGVKAVTGLNKANYNINGNTISIDMVSGIDEKEFSITGSLGKADKIIGLANFVKVATYKDNFKDVPADAWYAKSVANDYSVGIIAGTSAITYSPNDTLTLAQIITMASRVHAIYNGNGDNRDIFTAKTGEAWYQPYVSYAIRNGIIDSKAFTDYNKGATRAEMAYVISRCLPASEFKATVPANDFNDVNKYNPYYSNIATLYQAGITVGTGENNFSPNDGLTRAQAAVFVDRLINPSTRGGAK